MRTQPDGRLAALAAAGSEPAFEAIVHRYRRPLLGYCRRLRMADNRSEDVVQQTFLKAWGSLREGTEVRELRPWLYRITHNQAISMMRSIAGDETELDGAEYMIGGGSSADDVYERQARLRDTLRAISDLPALQREALLATAIDGLSYEETAEVLGVGADAVRGLVYRARNSVRAGMAVFSPAPLVAWAANQSSQVLAPEAAQLWTEATVGGGATVTLSAAALKGAVVLASSAAVVGGTVSTGLVKLPTATPRASHQHARAVGPGSGAVLHTASARAPHRGGAVLAAAHPGGLAHAVRVAHRSGMLLAVGEAGASPSRRTTSAPTGRRPTGSTTASSAPASSASAPAATSAPVSLHMSANAQPPASKPSTRAAQPVTPARAGAVSPTATPSSSGAPTQSGPAPTRSTSGQSPSGSTSATSGGSTQTSGQPSGGSATTTTQSAAPSTTTAGASAATTTTSGASTTASPAASS